MLDSPDCPWKNISIQIGHDNGNAFSLCRIFPGKIFSDICPTAPHFHQYLILLQQCNGMTYSLSAQSEHFAEPILRIQLLSGKQLTCFNLIFYPVGKLQIFWCVILHFYMIKGHLWSSSHKQPFSFPNKTLTGFGKPLCYSFISFSWKEGLP